MRLGDIANDAATPYGKPLDGVRVLALEQMQALPYATQMLARLGAEVIKVEHPIDGEMARPSAPFVRDPQGRVLGATFLRNNLDKRSIGIDLKKPEGRKLVLDLAVKFDVVAENFKAGTLARMGLGYDNIAAVNPRAIYLSISGFGNTVATPYDSWPAFAAVAEAMSGMYEFKRAEGQLPVVSPFGALGDTTSGLFAVIGVLAALRHREQTGLGQYVDIAMYDAMVSMADIVPNYYSMGINSGASLALIMDGFRASDGYFVVQCGRLFQFERLAEVVGHPDWIGDERLQAPGQWREQMDAVLRPGIEEWAAQRTKRECCEVLAAAGVAAGPCNSPADVVGDPHVAARNMLVEIPRPNGDGDPVLVPGNPVKMSRVAEGPETRMPWVGEHTEAILRAELGLGDGQLADLRASGAIV